MISNTTCNLDDGAKPRPRDSANDAETVPVDLAAFTHECFAPLGGVELELPPRGPMREPPDFS